MRKFQLTEKTKDRILNGALVISLILLVSGFVKPQGSRQAGPPPKSEYYTLKLSPLHAREIPVYEEVGLLPESQTKSQKAQAIKAGSTTPSSEALAQPAKSDSITPFTSTKNGVISASDALSKILKLANTQLF